MSSKRLGHEAMQRTEAALLASDLLERIRANRNALPGYSTSGLGAGVGEPSAMPLPDCNGNRCSAAQLSSWDLWRWEQALNGATTSDGAGGLVRPSACVDVDGRSVTIEIVWQGFRSLGSPDDEPADAPGCGAGNYGSDAAALQWLRVSSWIGEE